MLKVCQYWLKNLTSTGCNITLPSQQPADCSSEDWQLVRLWGLCCGGWGGLEGLGRSPCASTRRHCQTDWWCTPDQDRAPGQTGLLGDGKDCSWGHWRGPGVRRHMRICRGTIKVSNHTRTMQVNFWSTCSGAEVRLQPPRLQGLNFFSDFWRTPPNSTCRILSVISDYLNCFLKRFEKTPLSLECRENIAALSKIP